MLGHPPLQQNAWTPTASRGLLFEILEIVEEIVDTHHFYGKATNWPEPRLGNRIARRELLDGGRRRVSAELASHLL